jgi:hypothetical protein
MELSMVPTTIHLRGRQWVAGTPHHGDGLLMTATLTPPAEAVARANPADRLHDYLDALRYYLALPHHVIDRIVFVDNSNSDLAPLADLVQRLDHDKEVELIRFEGNDHPHQLGKAYGEFKLMDYGLANTTLFGPTDRVWKTTGRLKIRNLPEMKKQCEGLAFDVLCDLHNVPWVGAGKWRTPHHMDLRVFAFRMGAYDAVFRNLWRTHSHGLDAEFMYHHMRQNHPGLRITPRFPIQARLQGISGRHQRDYASHSQRTKDAVRAVTRRITPWLWL